MYYRKRYDNIKAKKKIKERDSYYPSGYYFKTSETGSTYYFRYYWSNTNKIMKRTTNKVIRQLKNSIATNMRPGEYRNHHDDWGYW